MDGYVDVETRRDGFIKSTEGRSVSLTQATVGCKDYPLWSKVPTELVLNSAYAHLSLWISSGTGAPAAPQFERNADSTLKRGANGELLGGIRHSQVVVPTGQNSAINSGPGTCILAGFHHDYNSSQLKAQYPDHITYVREVHKATQPLIKSGFILPDDAERISNSTATSDIAE